MCQKSTGIVQRLMFSTIDHLIIFQPTTNQLNLFHMDVVEAVQNWWWVNTDVEH